MTYKKQYKKEFFWSLLIVLIAVCWFGFAKQPLRSNPAKPKSPELTACTAEAKLCPDGSAVGRVPPDCEFAPCPGS